MNTILTKFDKTAIKVLGYADDILMLINGKVPEAMAGIMQKQLNKVLAWSVAQGLNFNPTKTTTVMFSKARKHKTKEPALYLNNKRLEYSNEMKYLKVTIQKRLTWSTHLNERIRKCLKLWNSAKQAIGREWGLNAEKLIWLHNAIVKPKLAYGALVWAASINKTTAKKLERIQRLALLAVTKTLRTKPTAAMEACTGLMPLEIYIKRETLKAAQRLRYITRRTIQTQK